MVEQELFKQFDSTQLSIADIEGLVAGLKDKPSWKDQSDPSTVSEWIVNGWKFIVDYADQLDRDLVESNDSISYYTRFATAWARLTRDLAAGSESFQNHLRPSINPIVEILWVTSAVVRLDHPNFKAFNQFSVQALSNLNTLNPPSIAHTWPLLVHCEDRQSIILRLLYTKNNRLLMIIGVLILNCVHQNPERIESLMNSCVGKKTMTMLLERLDGLLDDEKVVVFEVIVNLVREIINDEPLANVPKLYDSQATPSQVLSPSQLSILKIIESSTVLPSTSFLLQQFNRLSASLDQAWQGFVLIIEILVNCIQQIIATPHTSEHLHHTISNPDISSIVEISVRILKELSEQRSQLSHSSPAPTINSVEPQGNKDKKRSVNQIMIGLVKLLTNLIELTNSFPETLNGPVFIQDAVRTLDGFPVILNFTKFDVDFPYLREHSIVLIKYLLKNNPKNQEIIRNLQPLLPL